MLSQPCWPFGIDAICDLFGYQSEEALLSDIKNSCGVGQEEGMEIMEKGLKLLPCGPILYLAVEYDDSLPRYRLVEGSKVKVVEGSKDKDGYEEITHTYKDGYEEITHTYKGGYEEITHSLRELDKMEKEGKASYIYLKSTTEHSASCKCYQRFEDILNFHERYLRMKYFDIGCTVATKRTYKKDSGKRWDGIELDADFNKMLGRRRDLKDPGLAKQFEEKVFHDAKVRTTERMEELYKNPALLKRLARHADSRLPSQCGHDLGRLFIKNFALWEYVGLLKTLDMRFGGGIKAEHGLDLLLLKQAARQDFSDYIYLRDSYTKNDWIHIIKWTRSYAKKEDIHSGVDLVRRDPEVAAVLDFPKVRRVMNTCTEKPFDRMVRRAIAESKHVLIKTTGKKKYLTVTMLYYLLNNRGLTNLNQKDFRQIYGISKSTFHRRLKLIHKYHKLQSVKSWLEIFS